MVKERGLKRDRVLDAFERAVEDWTRRGNEQALTRWLDGELDAGGALTRLSVSDWPMCVSRLFEASKSAGSWPTQWNIQLTRLVKATLWFSRTDGNPVLDFDPVTPRLAAKWARRDVALNMRGSDVERVIHAWKSRTENESTRPAWGGSKRVLDVLRPGWPEADDFVAVDHRDAGSPCRFELFGAGRSWLGPSWQADLGHETMMSTPRPQFWVAESPGAFAEWSYRAGDARVTQSALILDEYSMAVLSILVERPGVGSNAPGVSLSLPPGIAASSIGNSRGMVLKPPNNRGSAQVLPIGLPALPYVTERGAFIVEDNTLRVKHAPIGRKCWIPIMVSWNAERHRKEVQWRILSVSEKSRNVTADRAMAVRVSWGRDETYIVYRSLAKPAPRAFLGHQTKARFLLASFRRDGSVKPIFSVD